MPRFNRPPSDCLIDSLPIEVLDRIFKLAANDAAWPRPYETVSILKNIALVCKGWSRSARQLLLSNVSLSEAGQAIVFYELLKYLNPMLALLVTRLDLEGITYGGSAHGLLRLLDVTPNITSLSLRISFCYKFRSHRIWNQLKHLRLELSGSSSFEADFQYHARMGGPSGGLDVMPNRLKSLELTGNIEDLMVGVYWPALFFPTLQRLKLHRNFAWKTHELLSKKSKLLPSTPALQALEVKIEIEDSFCEELWTRIVLENANRITTLVLEVEGIPHNFLSQSVLASLPHLLNLEYVGAVSNMAKDTCRAIFPPSLQRLKIAWRGCAEFGLHLLELLSDIEASFLPNLELTPSVVYHPGAITDDDTTETLPWGHATKNQLRDLLKLASRSHKTFLARCASREGILTRFSGLADAFVCLPFPQAYVSSLDYCQQSLIKTLMNSKEIPSEIDNGW